jgi:precorrin-2 dehydrogenase/sirohydrochlorin ferrochelatase
MKCISELRLIDLRVGCIIEYCNYQGGTDVKLYPLMMNIEGKSVAVVGGGKVALRKVRSLLECGAKVTVISPVLELELLELSEDGAIHWIAKLFSDKLFDDIPNLTLVFGTTDDRDVNVNIFRAAVERRVPCNIADVPDLCSFTVPAVVSRGDLTIAISTGGASPALARRTREKLEGCFGSEYIPFTQILGELRQEVLSLGGTSDENKNLFMRIVDSELLQAIKENDRNRAKTVLRSLIPESVNPGPIVDRAMQTPDGGGT